MNDNFDYTRRTWTNEEIAASCEAAADLLEGSWIRGDWHTPGVDPDGTPRVFMCLEGGLAAAIGLDADLMRTDPRLRATAICCPVFLAVRDTINEDRDPNYYVTALTGWNDEEAEGEAEVIEVLRRTAKRVLGVPKDQMEVTR